MLLEQITEMKENTSNNCNHDMISIEPCDHKNPIPRVHICKVRNIAMLHSFPHHFYSFKKTNRLYHILSEEHKDQDT